MKKILTITLALTMIFALAACNNENKNTENDDITSSSAPTPNYSDSSPVLSDEGITESKILIAYFTFPEPDGVDAVTGASRVVKNGEILGSTQFMAQIIQRETDGDLFAIETVQAYPARPDLMDLAQDEKKQNARPALSSGLENAGDYDVIFLGYPNWWADMPMPLYTFLETYDFSGKTIIPFCPHGGSGFSNTVKAIRDLQPNATVSADGLAISRDRVPNSESDVIEWVKELGVAQ